DAVVGFGGYASAPVLWAAQRMGVPTIIQEQNSYAGVTNKILSRGARRICVAYDGMERFFPADFVFAKCLPDFFDYYRSKCRVSTLLT
ncbi:MAG: glycosyltransferase, partial [Lachnospiraceae bacterium]|nr:glycosyltransferase [Lachnospiraceae bacterium]